MMWPPHRVKRCVTPSRLSARATSLPPWNASGIVLPRRSPALGLFPSKDGRDTRRILLWQPKVGRGVNVADAKGLAFACLPGCGFCCATSPLVHAHEAPALGPLVVNGRIPVKGLACAALGADRNCSVYGARPAACRLYPFMVHAGRRVQVTVALACPGVTEGPGAAAGSQAEAAATLALARPGAAEMAARAKETFAEFDRRMKEWGVFASADKLRSAFAPHVDALAHPQALPSYFAAITEGDLVPRTGREVGELFEAQ